MYNYSSARMSQQYQPKGHIEVIERERVRPRRRHRQWSQVVALVSSTKAALKAGQGARLTEV